MQAWKESKGGKGEEGGPVKGGREGGPGRKLIHLPSTQVLFLQLLKRIHPSSSLLLLPGFLAVRISFPLEGKEMMQWRWRLFCTAVLAA